MSSSASRSPASISRRQPMDRPRRPSQNSSPTCSRTPRVARPLPIADSRSRRRCASRSKTRCVADGSRSSVARQERCAVCGGEGWTSRLPAPCPECGGQGTRQWARGHMVFTKNCERCEGRGVLTSQTCRACAGAGLQGGTDVVVIDVPAGIETGARLVVPGRGHAVRGGAPGDLYVTVDVAAHPFFRRSGDDLVLTLPVAVHEAASGRAGRRADAGWAGQAAGSTRHVLRSALPPAGTRRALADRRSGRRRRSGDRDRHRAAAGARRAIARTVEGVRPASTTWT